MTKEFDPVLARKAVMFVCDMFDDWQTLRSEPAIENRIDALRNDLKEAPSMLAIMGCSSPMAIARITFYHATMIERESKTLIRVESSGLVPVKLEFAELGPMLEHQSRSQSRLRNARTEQSQESIERRMFPLPCAQCFGTRTTPITSIEGELAYVPCSACQGTGAR